MICCSILNQHLEKVSSRKKIIQVGINDLLNNTTSTEGLLQNILKIAARCKTYRVSKKFVKSVLQTCKVSIDMVAKLN